MPHVIARITAKPGSAAVLHDILMELVRHTRQEAGCVRYELYQREDEPEIFETVEEWRDAESVDAHMRSPHVGAAIAAGSAHFGAPPEIKTYGKLA